MKTKAFIITHLGLGDNINCIGLVRYITTFYEIVVVVCKKQNLENLKLFYKDNNKIKLLPVINDSMISPRYGFNLTLFNNITKEYDVYLTGLHRLDGKTSNFDIVPYTFYIDLNIECDIFWKYFSIPDIDESKKLYNILQSNNINEYVIIHNSSSFGKLFEIDKIENIIKRKKEEILYINFNENCYLLNDKYYNIAQSFINKPLIYYKDTIINASHIYLSDSSILCMAFNLNIKTSNCYYISRSNKNYDYIYSNIYISNDCLINKQKFKQVIL